MENRENSFMVDGEARRSKNEKFGMNPNSMDTAKEWALRAIAANLPGDATIDEIISAEKKLGRFTESDEEPEDLRLAA